MSTNINTVLITGASSGIGLGLDQAFLKVGSNVVLNARNSEKLSAEAKKLGNSAKVALVPGDIGLKETGERLVKVAVERFGSADVLVNNAGIFGVKPFLDSTEEDLDRYFTSNLKGTYFASQAAVRQMKKQGGGAIINIGTVLITHSLAAAPASAALASKGAIHALTISLASEFAADNIRVNAVAPGIVRTPMHGSSDVNKFAGIHPLNRIAEVKDITDAVIYLATANFTSGIIMPVDGGYISGRP